MFTTRKPLRIALWITRGQPPPQTALKSSAAASRRGGLKFDHHSEASAMKFLHKDR